MPANTIDYYRGEDVVASYNHQSFDGDSKLRRSDTTGGCDEIRVSWDLTSSKTEEQLVILFVFLANMILLIGDNGVTADSSTTKGGKLDKPIPNQTFRNLYLFQKTSTVWHGKFTHQNSTIHV